jgi:hypothetical protein
VTGTPLTQAQKDALRARGFTDDTMRDIPPEEADQIIRNITPEHAQKILKRGGAGASLKPDRATPEAPEAKPDSHEVPWHEPEWITHNYPPDYGAVWFNGDWDNPFVVGPFYDIADAAQTYGLAIELDEFPERD